MERVYLGVEADYDEYDIFAVYSDKEEAYELKNFMTEIGCENIEIDEFAVDIMPLVSNIRNGLKVKTTDGKIIKWNPTKGAKWYRHPDQLETCLKELKYGGTLVTE